VDANNPNYASEGGILYNKAKTQIVTVPRGISGTVTLPNSLTAIGEWEFADCTGLTSIIIPASVMYIGRNAFDHCTSLTSVTFESDIDRNSFGYMAFPSGSFYDFEFLYSGAGTYTRDSDGSDWEKQKPVSDITPQTCREGSAVTLTAPQVNFPGTTEQGWQISDNGSGGWSNFTLPATANLSDNGKYLRYYATNGSETYYSNTVTIRILSPTEQEITIAMWDGFHYSWNGNAALRISVNGTDLTTNARLKYGESHYYTFPVDTGDVVRIYWVNGNQFDKAIAFAVYYSDVPPSPAFNPAKGITGGNVLVSKRYNNPAEAVGDGTLMGEFTVP